MAGKKQETHEEYIKAITDAQSVVDSLKADYKSFQKENPLSLKKQPTPHELRMMNKNLGTSINEEHAKVNSAHARAVKSKRLNRKIEGK